VKHELYFWREERPIEPAADNLLERIAEDRNLPSVVPLSLATIKSAFSRYFPGLIVADFKMEWKVADGSFQVSFSFDDCNQPTSVRISSESPLVETLEVFERIFAVARELGCTSASSR
jgi:hypothetical protein